MPAPPTHLLLVALVDVTFTPIPFDAADWMIIDGDIQIQPIRSFADRRPSGRKF